MVRHRHTAEDLFCEALDLPQGQREAYLEASGRDSPELLPLVRELLAEHDRAGHFLETPVLGHVPREALGTSAQRDSPVGFTPARPTGQEVSPRFVQGQLLADRFVVVRFLARGGMGEVYEVEDRLLQGEHVALKAIRPEIAEESGSSLRFEQEVLLARKVHHPNLCPIYEIFRCEQPEPAFLFLTMKLLHGETLDGPLRRHATLTRHEIIEICARLMSGVAAIHAAGIVHRDIKPRNVILERTGRRLGVYLLDFGLARLHRSEATVLRTGMVAGTPGYLAPELLLGRAPTRASDLFALGVVLHQVLCGATPLEAPDGLSLLPAPELRVADAPTHLIEAVEGLLSSNPEERSNAFRTARAARRATGPATLLPASPTHTLTRRAFASATVCALAATAGWQRNWIYERVHPLPRKRFVALLDWPPPTDVKLRPMLLGLIDAIANELARAEAFDRDLLVVAQTAAAGQTSVATLRHIRESLGANLVLAASARNERDRLNVSLNVLDSATGKSLRSKELSTSVRTETTFAQRAVQAASELLDVQHYEPDEQRLRPGTDQPAALAAFQSAEGLIRQDDDTGLAQAIAKYREAVNLDPHYAVAFAKLAQAYARSFTLTRDTGALHLAQANSEHALALDSMLVEGHLSRAVISKLTGDQQSALDELGKALSLDPSNTKTLLWQAQIYTRLNRWPDAERAFHRVIAARPNLWLTYNELGFFLHSQGRWKDAIEAFRTAGVAAPGNAMVATNLGLEYLQIGALSEALKCLNRGLVLQPNYDAASAYMSLALRYQKRFQDALPFALKATQANPEEDTNWLELGDCYAALGHREKEAQAAYLRAATEAAEHLRTDPTDGPGWMMLALYQVKTRDAVQAAASLQRAESLGTDDMDSLLYKIRVLELLGRREDALFSLKHAFARGATSHQLELSSDLKALRADARYTRLQPAGSIS